MEFAEESVLPDTAEKIRSARRKPSTDWAPPYRNIGAILKHRAVFSPHENFLTFVDSDYRVSYSYSEFYSLVLRAAAVMHGERMGIRAGDRIVTLCVNDPRTVVIYFAAWVLGAVVAPVNCSEDDDRLAYIVSNSGAKGLFVMSDQRERLSGILAGSTSSPVFIEVDGVNGDFDNAVRSAEPFDPNALPQVMPNSECLIVYTSGTTGAPKGVVLEQGNLIADAESIAEWHKFASKDRALCVLPIHHVNGTVVTLVTPLFTGGSVVLTRKFHAHSFWQVLESERCTWVSVVPTVLAFLCERKQDLTKLDLQRFRHIVCGAGPLTVELARRFEQTFGIRVVHGYGLSETTCYSCFLPIDLNREEYTHWMFECGFPSIGCPVPANDMAIHDSEGNALPPDARGEIVIRGYNVMRCYFKRPEANRDAFAHSWFRSGDEGFYRVGSDGREYYFITGRLKELFIRGGINYSPFDIDEVLTAIPGIKAAMAVGFENNFYGEEIGAYVQLEEGATLTEDEIVAACLVDLPYAKSPKVVLFGTDFPVTSTGKYQRNKLKPLFAQWKNSLFREQH